MRTRGMHLIVCTALVTVATLATGSISPAEADTLTTLAPTGGLATITRTAGPAAPAQIRRAAGRLDHRAVPPVPGRAAYLFDATSGTVHLSKQAAKRMPVASLTKVMTAYVVLREATLSDTVTVKAEDVKHASANGATHAGLRSGERLTVRDLLYGVMLPSGADASHALARVYGPGNARFVAKMNLAARSLGLADTRYANPDGLPKPSPGYSTARDQAKLADIALRDPTLRIIASAGRHAVTKTRSHRAHTWTNSNKLLGKAPGALGLKTGYTNAAGYCLSFAADRDGHRLIGVILGESNADRRFQTATRLLDWASEQTTIDDIDL
ncbi:D-alanyl-D-alanine carboxypeptidase family protein [Streptosporangium lutulentum]|uniref:D-alanyl-D-alanine carboxypeptidase (Penicillin-binding protein 5/6) n=1 Tax=Streptosporangium lutulentum TaxID=1461250 RepID=A0ABT9QT55_9ACTN|nr:D-alanyl-D-alanine carboxypeptidase family protein [Streptosporangium lutulentum]MDP9849929.1 D-alanyl-D-alanine carboxypeptidase (penicillin-binding protein 5/6) [Streptosporangium lutulentum]